MSATKRRRGVRRIQRLAFEMADAFAISTLEVELVGEVEVLPDGTRRRWLDCVTDVQREVVEDVCRSSEYLELRGRLAHHPHRKGLVRILEVG